MFAQRVYEGKGCSTQQTASSGKGQGNTLYLESPSRSTEARPRKRRGRLCLHSPVDSFLTPHETTDHLLHCGHLGAGGGLLLTENLSSWLQGRQDRKRRPPDVENREETSSSGRLALGQLYILLNVCFLIPPEEVGSRPSVLLSQLRFFDSNSTVLGESLRDIGATS